MCDDILLNLLGVGLGAGLSVWLAIAVERRRVRSRFEPLKDYVGEYVASEVRDGVTKDELFHLRLERHPKVPHVLNITGRTRVLANPEFTGELVFTERLRSATGSYVHDGNPNMFGFFDVQVLAGQQISFHVHQRFIMSGVTVLRNLVWQRYSGPAWDTPAKVKTQVLPSSSEGSASE